MKFSSIRGKEEIKSRLVQRVDSERIPHAQLFHGKKGSGLLPAALSFTSYLFCEQKSNGDSCGVCKACVKIDKLIHPDVHFSFPVISPKKSSEKSTSDLFMAKWREMVLENPHISYEDWMIGIDAENKQGNISRQEVSNIIGKLAFKPFEAKQKIMIIWLAEHLGQEGNALLKLIEEPPSNTFFILIAENLDKLLPTILSRVQLTQIPLYTAEEIKAELMSKEVEEAEAETVGYLSGGDMSAAFHLVESTDNSFTESFRMWMRYCFNRKTMDLMTWSDAMAGKGREGIKSFLLFSLSLVRESLAYLTIPDYQIRLPLNESEFIKNFSKVLQIVNIETLYTEINKAISEIERNANPKIVFLNLSITFRDAFYQTRVKS